MIILHLSTRLILGGSQENTVLSCEGQARRGHDVHLAFGPIEGPEGSLGARVESFRTPDGRAITPHVVPDLVRAVSPVRDRRALAQLRTLIAGLRPDIVHTHSSKAGVLGRLAAWDVMQSMTRPDRAVLGSSPPTRFAGLEAHARLPRGGIGIVHTIHGPPFMPVEGSLASRLMTRAINHAYALAERRAARRCQVIVSVADAMTRQFLARGIGTPDQYVTVHSGMEIEQFLPPADAPARRAHIRCELGLDADDLVIGTVARLAQHKGHDDLLTALGDELRTRPRWKLLWVGDGWWRERLVARVRTLGLEKQVVCTGLVPPARVSELLGAMDVLAHPSSREGLPRTVPQALLAGVCPVAYDCDGTGEVCQDMVTGRLVPTGNTTKLREAIVWCAEHPAQRDALARRGRELCLERFGAERMVDNLEKVYARAIALARR